MMVETPLTPDDRLLAARARAHSLQRGRPRQYEEPLCIVLFVRVTPSQEEAILQHCGSHEAVAEFVRQAVLEALR